MTLSDYVTTDGWGEIGRYQAELPRQADPAQRGGHHLPRPPQQPRQRALRRLPHVGDPRAAGRRVAAPDPRAAPAERDLLRDPRRRRFTQVNHPTIFPSAVPTFSSFCRGCPWDYSDAETDWSRSTPSRSRPGPPALRTGPRPGPNPFTPLALAKYEDVLDTGATWPPSASATRTPRATPWPTSPTSPAPLGMATTVVHAPELSEQGIERGVKAGHTYVKVWGNAGPDIRLEARDGGRQAGRDHGRHRRRQHRRPRPRPGRPAVVGPDRGAQRPVRAGGLFRDRVPVLVVPIVQDDQTVELPTVGTARYRIQLQRSSSIEAVSCDADLGHGLRAGSGAQQLGDPDDDVDEARDPEEAAEPVDAAGDLLPRPGGQGGVEDTPPPSWTVPWASAATSSPANARSKRRVGQLGHRKAAGQPR